MRLVLSAILALAVVAQAVPAVAAPETSAIVVPLGKMQVLRLPRDAANVVLGDPSVANVTVEDPRTLFLFGRQPGETNLVIFDANRQPILDRPLSVRGGSGSVTVYTPAAPGAGMDGTVWNCSDKCARTSTGAGGIATEGDAGAAATGTAPPAQ